MTKTNKLLAIGLMGMLRLGGPFAQAAITNITWTGATSNSWGVPTNWNPQNVPDYYSASNGEIAVLPDTTVNRNIITDKVYSLNAINMTQNTSGVVNKLTFGDNLTTNTNVKEFTNSTGSADCLVLDLNGFTFQDYVASYGTDNMTIQNSGSQIATWRNRCFAAMGDLTIVHNNIILEAYDVGVVSYLKGVTWDDNTTFLMSGLSQDNASTHVHLLRGIWPTNGIGNLIVGKTTNTSPTYAWAFYVHPTANKVRGDVTFNTYSGATGGAASKLLFDNNTSTMEELWVGGNFIDHGSDNTGYNDLPNAPKGVIIFYNSPTTARTVSIGRTGLKNDFRVGGNSTDDFGNIVLGQNLTTTGMFEMRDNSALTVADKVLTCGSFNDNATTTGATLNYTVGSEVSGAINVNGNLNLNKFILNVTNSGGGLNPSGGTITLFTYSGTLSGTSAITVGTVPAGFDWTLTAGGGQVHVTYAPHVGGSTVQGTVELQDFTGNVTLVPVTIEIRGVDNATPLEGYVVNLDNTSRYSFTTSLTGPYDIVAKASHWLRQKKGGVNLSAATTVDFSLVNGDSDGDNEVTLADLSMVLSAMDARPNESNWDPTADLDGDGEVTSTDLSIVLANMDKMGDDSGITPNSIRIYLDQSYPQSIYIRPTIHRLGGSPYSIVPGYISEAGFTTTLPATGTWLQPGHCTPWIDLSPFFMGSENHVDLVFYSSGGVVQNINVAIKVAGPDIEGIPSILKELTEQVNGSTVILAFLANPPQTTTDVLSGNKITTQNLQFVTSLPDTGTRPTQFIFSACFNLDQNTHSVQLVQKEASILANLGINSVSLSGVTPGDVMFGDNATTQMQRFRDGPLSYLNMLPYYHPNEDAGRIYANNLKNSLSGYESYLDKLYVADEPAFDLSGLDNLSHTQECINEYHDNFTLFTDNTSYSPPYYITTFDNRTLNPENYYYSTLYSRYKTRYVFAKATEILKDNFTDAKTMADFAEGYLFFNMRASLDWWDIMKSGALTTGWTEAHMHQHWYGIPQMISYVADCLRSACKYHDNTSYGLYEMTIRPVPTRQEVYSAIGRGCREINFYLYGPFYCINGSIDYCWSSDPNRQAEIKKITHEIGQAEDLIMAGKPVAAQTAILYSTTTEIWAPSIQSPYGTPYDLERIGVYLALCHDQIPVDLLTEDDVTDDYLTQKGYKVLYLVGDHIRSAAADKIKSWVSAGGVLWGDAGAGRRDEFDAPLTTLDPVFGITGNTLTFKDYAGRLKTEFILKPSYDNITVHADNISLDNMSVLSYTESLTVGTGTTIGTFKDNSTAVVSHGYDNGTARRIAALPGLAYLQKPVNTAYYLARNDNVSNNFWEPAQNPDPTGHPYNEDHPDFSAVKDIRSLITRAAYLAGVSKPVTLASDNASLDLTVEASCLKSADKGIAVVLVNYTPNPIDNLIVTVHNVDNVSSVAPINTTLVNGYQYNSDNKTVTFKLTKLDLADVIKILK